MKETIKKYIVEYLTKDVVALKNYLTSTPVERIKYLPHDYHYFISDFIDEFGYSLDGYDGETYDIIITLEEENPELYREYGEWLYNKIEEYSLEVPDSDYPAWSFFDRDIQIIKNEWLIHFTEKGNAYDIAKDGFTIGVDEIDKLGLTTHLSQIDKEYGGFNFAYTIDDFKGYAKSGGLGSRYEYKYGNEAVLFQASGVRTWHYGDEEHQTIFYGSTAKNIIPITSGHDSSWAIYHINGNILFENDDLERVVDWVLTNYHQYRNVIG